MLLCKNDDKYYTQTCEGRIPHLNAKIGGFELCMPVKIASDSRGSPTPVKDVYGYVYALPANGSINLKGERSWPR
jgi:hypothetical protein